MGQRSGRRRLCLAAVAIAVLGVMVGVGCGTDSPEPTATPTLTPASSIPTPTPAPATPTPTLAPGEPTPIPPTPTATAAPLPTEPPPADETAFNAEEYFSSKTIEIIVPYSPGGGYDTFSRMLAIYLPRYIPGEPRFFVRNLVGGGGERGVRYTMKADPDGFTMATLHPNFIARELAGVDIPDFELDSLVYLGALSGTGSMGDVWVRREIAESWDDLIAQDKTINLGSVSPGQSSEQGAEFVEMLGGPVRIVYGYDGSSDIMAAMDRGELDATGRVSPRNVRQLFPEWIETQQFVPLFRWGDPATPEEIEFLKEMGFDKDWSEIPHIYEITNASQGFQNAFDTAYQVIGASRGYILPPGTPDEIVQVWRQAIAAAAEDADFIEHAGVAGYDQSAWGYIAPDVINDLLGVVAGLSEEEHQVFSRLLGATQ